MNNAVLCIELDKFYNGAKQASEELGISRDDIVKACKGMIRTAGGYHWVSVRELFNRWH